MFRKYIARGLLIISVAAASIWLAGLLVADRALTGLNIRAEQRTTLYLSSLKAALNRYDYLPFVVAQEVSILALMQTSQEGSLQLTANEYLERMNQQAGAAALYVLNRDGTTVAASNWNTPDSFVGQNYHFRPYFQTALQGEPGRYFAIGVTTNIPGYFLSYPIKVEGRILGVAVVKVDLDPLQHDWASGGENIFVADENGVVVLSSRAEWRYRHLATLSKEVVAKLKETRQYNRTDPTSMNWQIIATKSHGIELISLAPEIDVPDPSQSNTSLPAQLFFTKGTGLEDFGWTMYFLAAEEDVTRDVVTVRIMTGILAVALTFAILYLRQRQHTRKLRRASRAELEAKIEERTQELRETQNSLVQAGKLAALGQMSAAIAHELNQPLAALRTFAASAQMLIERDEQDKASNTVTKMDNLIDRMAQITSHLKQFARKSPKKLEPTEVYAALDQALSLLEPDIRLNQVAISVERNADAPAVLGDMVRLEQVFINLVRNAIDAMEGQETRELKVRIEEADGQVQIFLQDTGPGIGPQDMGQLFDPFFTTKEVGKGLGLGLSLSYGIIRDFGGEISATNAGQQGALFEIRLPACEQQIRTAGAA